MKRVAILLCILMFAGCGKIDFFKSDIEKNDGFMTETLGMALGAEMKDSFEWTPEVEKRYQDIMDEKLSLGVAQAVEAYLSEHTHPLIANRVIRLAGIIGFDLDDAGSIIGIGDVDMRLLQAAASGFKQGLLLE